MCDGFISLHRALLDWEWYKDTNTKSLFIHCLLKANYKDNNWRGMVIKRGQFFTSIEHLSSELALSIKEIRTSLNKLEKTSEICKEGASNGTMITVCKYDIYQTIKASEGQTKGQAKGKRGAGEGQQLNKDNKVNKEIIYSPFYDSEIFKSENNDKYIQLVKFIFGNNQLGSKLENVLSIDKQLSFDQFNNLLITVNETKVKLSDILLEMENWKDIRKKHSVYLTANKWMKNNGKNSKGI